MSFSVACCTFCVSFLFIFWRDWLYLVNSLLKSDAIVAKNYKIIWYNLGTIKNFKSVFIPLLEFDQDGAFYFAGEDEELSSRFTNGEIRRRDIFSICKRKKKTLQYMIRLRNNVFIHYSTPKSDNGDGLPKFVKPSTGYS